MIGFHEIKNQNGYHLIDEKIRDEIIYALDHDMTYTYFKGTRIDIVSDKKTDSLRETIVKVGV